MPAPDTQPRRQGVATSRGYVKGNERHSRLGSFPKVEERAIMLLNLRHDSAWGIAHDLGMTSRTSCDHNFAPVPEKPPPS